MFSMIMPANNCKKELDVNIDPDEDPIEYYTQLSKGINPIQYKIYTPEVQLGPFSGKNENYYIHWLKDRELYTGETFYMSCNFFNAKTGKSIRMVNRPSAGALTIPPLPEGFYEPLEWYYYQVILSIDKTQTPVYSYMVRKFNNTILSYNLFNGLNNGQQVGVGNWSLLNPGQPIKFFQSHLP